MTIRTARTRACKPAASAMLRGLAAAVWVAALAVPADDFNARRAAFLNYYATAVPNVSQTGSGPHRIGRTGFWAAEGRFLAQDLANGSNYMNAALGDADSEGPDAGFGLWPAMDCFLRWSPALPSVFTPAITNYFQTQLTGNGTNYSSGATSNQRMMLATARYLAGCVWGTNAFPSGAQFQADYGTGDPTGKAYVSNTIANLPRYGFPEHDSLIYVQFTLGPVYTLSQFAPDPVLRNKAKLAFDWAVAEMAGYYFYDHWAIASDRTEPYWVQNQPSSTTMMTYLLFGGPTPSSYLESYPSALYCQSNFVGVLPEVILAATNRARSYTACTTAMRNTGGYNNAYFKTSYLTPGYALYSQTECGVATNSDGTFITTNFGTVSLSDPHQMQRWGVLWNAPGDQTKFWITNPYNPVYSGSSPNLYIGTTVSEQVVQLGGTLAAVYAIPTNSSKPDWNHNGVAMTNYQVLEGQIPTNYSAVIDNAATSGRLYLHYTNVLIALCLSTNFTWNADPNLTNYFLIPANIAGLAVETAAPEEYTQSTAALRLAAFRNDVLTLGRANLNSLMGANPEMLYTDRHGNTLQIVFGVGAKTNGQSLNYQQWPTISNPWMEQTQLGDLVISGTSRTITCDFHDWMEFTNNRPVLAAIPDRTMNAGMSLLITNTATDADQPPQTLTFALPLAPTNASLSPLTGLLAWRPTVAQADSTNLFQVTVTDNGTPSLTATQSFTVTVNRLHRPVLTAPGIPGTRFGFQANGDFGPDYTIQASTNLTVWADLATTNSPALPFFWTDASPPVWPQTFYRLRLGP